MRQVVRVRRPQQIPVRVFAALLALPCACSSGGGKSGAGGTGGGGGVTGTGGAATGSGGATTGTGGAGTGGAGIPTGLLNPDITTIWNPGILADTQLNVPLGADGLPVRTTVCASPKPG